METRIKRMPLVGPEIARWGEDIQKLGVQRAMLNLLSRFNTKVNICYSDNTRQVLESGAGVVAVNHPFYIEPVVLMAAMPDRSDFYLIGNTLWRNLSEGFDRQLIPVYVRHHMFTNNDRFIRSLVERLHYYPDLSPGQEDRLNLRSLKDAAGKVEQGGMVGIFPLAGRRGQDENARDWFPGIGILMHQVKDRSSKYLVNAYISGPAANDWLRALPYVGKFMADYKVEFSEATPLSEVVLGDVRATTQQAQRGYEGWLRSRID